MPLETDPAVRSGRAAPLPPDERRSAILQAVQPVLLARGVGVSTRDLAQAAGVAEGTLFRVFEDKASLLRAAVEAATDPVATAEQLGSIDLGRPLAERLAEAAAAATSQVRQIWLWMGLAHQLQDATGAPGDDRSAGPGDKHARFAGRQKEAARVRRGHLRRLLEPDAAVLRLPLDDAVSVVEVMFGGLVMARMTALRSAEESDRPDVSTVVDVLMHGLVNRPDTSRNEE